MNDTRTREEIIKQGVEFARRHKRRYGDCEHAGISCTVAPELERRKTACTKMFLRHIVPVVRTGVTESPAGFMQPHIFQAQNCREDQKENKGRCEFRWDCR